MSSESALTTRHQFLRQLTTLGAGVLSYPTLHALAAEASAPTSRRAFRPDALAGLQGEAFWDEVRLNYEPDEDFINLENGYFSPMAISVREAHEREMRRVNRLSSFHLRRLESDELTVTRQALARFARCTAEELVITRNTTESLNTIISGIAWRAGDEVVVSDQDYPSMQQQLEQAARRWGVVLKRVALPLHPESDEQIVQHYERAIGPRTRLLLITHLINFSGQLLPAKTIIAMAHQHQVEVLVDAAHSFGHVPMDFHDLGCDYLGTSLHKWLGAPLGLGLLFVRRDRIEPLWPLYGDQAYPVDDIRKLEHVGTRPVHAINTINAALQFHAAIGTDRKTARLRALRAYWTDRAKDLPGIEMLSPLDPTRSGAIACVSKRGRAPDELANHLWEKHRLFSVAINHPVINGVRITPHLYTRFSDLDQLVEALRTC